MNGVNDLLRNGVPGQSGLFFFLAKHRASIRLVSKGMNGVLFGGVV
jgi:hypothetical protein